MEQHITITPDESIEVMSDQDLCEVNNFLYKNIPFEIMIFFLVGFCPPVLASTINESVDSSQNVTLVVNDGQLKTVRGGLINKQWLRINYLSELKDGWGQKDSKAMSLIATDLLRSSLLQLDDDDVKGWIIFPDPKGYYYLDYKGGKDRAGVTVTDNSIIYFVKKQGYLHTGQESLTSDNLNTLIRSVHE